MKIAILSGAYINAGDYLIERRSCELIRYVIPNAELLLIKRNKIEQNIDEINSCDAVVLAGGPVYENKPENILPVETLLYRVKPRIMVLGGGWYGINNANHTPFDYKFSKKGILLLKKIDEEGFGLGCRDIPTFKTLRKEGFNQVVLTGCPAWYYIDKLEKGIIFNTDLTARNICISDAANRSNYVLLKQIIIYLKNKFNDANITLVIHRDNDKELNGFSALGVNVVNISSNADGMNIYLESDLHIGFRVHAHIFCLSAGKKSILIEEDGRGGGVNETLGTPSIKAYDDEIETYNMYINKVRKLFKKYNNPNILQEIDSYLILLQQTNYRSINNSINSIGQYFSDMLEFVRRLEQ